MSALIDVLGWLHEPLPLPLAIRAAHEPERALAEAWATSDRSWGLLDVHALTLPVGQRRTYLRRSGVSHPGRAWEEPTHDLLRIERRAPEYARPNPWTLFLRGAYRAHLADPTQYMGEEQIRRDDAVYCPSLRALLPAPTLAAVLAGYAAMGRTPVGWDGAA